GQQLDMFDEEERARINVFDWETEFVQIMSSGGFDAVIGNPPYVKEYTNRQPFELVRHSRNAKYYQGKMDLWYIFTCFAIDLVRIGGYHSFIATNNWITSAGASLLRKKVTSETSFLSFLDFGAIHVFTKAGIQTAIFVLLKTGTPNTCMTSFVRLRELPAPVRDLDSYLENVQTDDVVKHEVKVPGPSAASFTFSKESTTQILDRMDDVGDMRLSKQEMTQGIVCPQDIVTKAHLSSIPDATPGEGIFVLPMEKVDELGLSTEEASVLRPYYTTTELQRFYGSDKTRLRIIYLGSNADARIGELPNLKQHLDQFATVITSHYGPYGLHRARNESFFSGDAVVSLRKTKRPHFTYVDFPCYVSQTFNVIKSDRIEAKYLTGILNSKVAWFWLESRGKKQGDQLQVDSGPLQHLPIVSNVDSSAKDDLISRVEFMLRLCKKSASTKTSHERQALERQIEATDREIDQLVYELYELTDEEIKIVEEATAN
ncbi:MAG: methyltransferase, partial [Planctomycetota bacterium]